MILAPHSFLNLLFNELRSAGLVTSSVTAQRYLSRTKFLGQLWLIVVARWLTVRNVRIAVSLAKDLFANKDPTIAKSLDVQIHFKLAGLCRLPYFTGFPKMLTIGQQTKLIRHAFVIGDFHDSDLKITSLRLNTNAYAIRRSSKHSVK